MFVLFLAENLNFDIIIYMLNSKNFLNDTLTYHSRGLSVRGILTSAINAVEPGEAIQRFVKRDGNRLYCDGVPYEIGRASCRERV